MRRLPPEGWVSEEQSPDDFRSMSGVAYNGKRDCYGWTKVEILPFLKGERWSEIALGYVHGFKPSCIRVTTGEVTCDSSSGRVTVYVDDGDIILGIEMEISIGLRPGMSPGLVNDIVGNRTAFWEDR